MLNGRSVWATLVLGVALSLVGCSEETTGTTTGDVTTGKTPNAGDALVGTDVPEGDTGPDASTQPGLCAAGQCEIDGSCYDSGAENPANPCEACQPSAAANAWTSVDGIPCDDGNACTTNDQCAAGACGGEAKTCDDDNACTDDTCDPKSGCVFTNHTRACDDGSVCTLDDVCADGECTGTPLDCDDGNSCTIDKCKPAEGCTYKAAELGSCRPQIIVDYPPRGATIAGTWDNQVVTVTGTVESPVAPLTWFELNGEEVTVAADGTFSHDVVPAVGGNTLVFMAEDGLSLGRQRVQAFLWSTEYNKPDVPKNGIVTEGLGIFLAQEVLDDGDRSLPPDDIATIFKLVLDNFDLSSFFDASAPLASQAGYDIYLTGLTLGGTKVSLQAIDGGLHINASMLNVAGTLKFDCTEWYCQLAGGDSTGGLTVDSIDISADLVISVLPDHTLDVQVQNATTSVNNVDIYSNNGWTNFLISLIEGIILDGVDADLENELNTQLSSVLGPMLSDALGALAFNLDLGLPKLDGSGQEIPISLVSDFQLADFQDANPGPQGGTFILRAGAYSTNGQVTPYDNLGVPGRVMCGPGGQAMALLFGYPFELGLADDLLNQILHAAWFGGMLDFPVPESLLGGVDLTQYGVTDLTMSISGMLAPTATDCNETQELIAHIGDLGVSANLTLFGLVIDLQIWASLTAGIVLAAGPDGIGISLTDVKSLDTEVTVLQDDLVAFEPIITDLIEEQLIGGLLGSLGGDALGSFPLPEIDLSEQVGLPPGTAVIAISPDVVERVDGNTVVGGSLAQ